MAKLESLVCDSSFNDWRSSVSSSSRQSYATDEGYHSDEKQRISWINEELDNSTEQTEEQLDNDDDDDDLIDTQQNEQQQEDEQPKQHGASESDREIPILKSTRTIRITYTPITYTLTLTIIALSFHILITHPPPWAHTFPPVFVLFHFTFHITHLIAHLFGLLTLERHCVVYGTWLFWTGWLLGVFVFSQRLVIDLSHPTTTLFWLLMVERRNAWGILVWEYVGRLDQNLTPQPQPQHQGDDDGHVPLKWWQIGSIRLLAFRIWCLLGTGSFWGLLYIALAKHDGYSLLYLLQVRHIFQLLLVSVAGGLMMIIFWSFWTFQYRGILWQKELRKGIVVWYSEGLALAGDVE
ncbi:hypothetical protein [Absidia glauca]|uniref:Uncharacterized protein n=1 Tax=Absidia glauca TaxID=4829 RepID=A0A163KWJ9_ABSGL|nr:hypothetical protein [Absidia glauca]